MASLTPKKALLYESLFSPVGDDNAKCNTCGKVLVSRDGNISGLWRHLNFNHKEKYNEFEKKKKELEESRKTKRPAQGGDAGPAPKKAKEDFFKNPSDMDRDLDRRFHEALISHMAETCTPFHQYGESFQQLISVANKRIKVKSRFTLSRIITRKAEEVRHEIATIIASVLDDLLSLGFTSDLWTSRALCNSNIPGIPDPGNSQDFPGIPGNTVLQFPSRKSGMEFFTLIPVPENGNGIFIPVPVPENWIGIFHLDSRSRKMGMEFAISRSRSRSPKVIPAHGCCPRGNFSHLIPFLFLKASLTCSINRALLYADSVFEANGSFEIDI